MKHDDVKKLANHPRKSRVHLKDGRTLVGHLEHHEEDEDIFNVVPEPSRPGVIEGGVLEDIRAEDIESIE